LVRDIQTALKKKTKSEEEEFQEKLDLKKADMGDVVKDFYKSDAPQFKGRSKEKRREMAIAAKLTAERGKLPEEVETVDEMFGGSSSGGRADRGDEVGRRERVKRAQEAKAKRTAVKDTPIDKYKPSPAMARYLAKTKKEEVIWEDGDSVKKITEDDMKGMSVSSGHKRPTKSGAGMTAKGVAAYRRRNPGSKLKTAVTTKPSKLKKGSKAANRRKSYCARSAGQMKKFPKAAKDPNSRLRQARRRWNC